MYPKENKQYRYWITTLSCAKKEDQPKLCDDKSNGLVWIYGQKERGAGGFLHWQFMCAFKRGVYRGTLKKIWQEAHCEPSRSDAADKYCRKEETRIEGTEFEEGTKAIKRNSEIDWVVVKNLCKAGNLDSIPEDIFVRMYSSCKAIQKDYQKQVIRGKQTVNLYWGVSGSGKSHRAFEEVRKTGSFYEKGPTTKWWDGYQGEENIIIDDFMGEIGFTHLKRWLDENEVKVETKHGMVPLKTKNWWITSNVCVEDWYPSAAQVHKDAVRRRIGNIVHYTKAFEEMMPFEVDQELINQNTGIPEIPEAIQRLGDDDEEGDPLFKRRNKDHLNCPGSQDWLQMKHDIRYCPWCWKCSKEREDEFNKGLY